MPRHPHVGGLHADEPHVVAERPAAVRDRRGAPGEHRGRGLARVEAACVHFGDQGHEVGFGAPGVPQHIRQTTKQLVIRDELQGVRVFHAENIGRVFRSSWDRACSTP